MTFGGSRGGLQRGHCAEFIAFSIFMLTAVTCLSLSAAYHTLMNHSQPPFVTIEQLFGTGMQVKHRRQATHGGKRIVVRLGSLPATGRVEHARGLEQPGKDHTPANPSRNPSALSICRPLQLPSYLVSFTPELRPPIAPRNGSLESSTSFRRHRRRDAHSHAPPRAHTDKSFTPLAASREPLKTFSFAY